MIVAWKLLVAVSTFVAITWLIWTVASGIESWRYERRGRSQLRLVHSQRRRRHLLVLRFNRSGQSSYFKRVS